MHTLDRMTYYVTAEPALDRAPHEQAAGAFCLLKDATTRRYAAAP